MHHALTRLLAITYVAIGFNVYAKPSGAELLAACEGALAMNFRGLHGKMCTWYVTPCDCDTRTATDLPRVCLPEPIVVRRLAVEVTEVLKAIPKFQEIDAERAATLILSSIYPCTEP